MVTSWLTSDSTLAIYVAAVEAANPSGQIRDLPELQPLILTAQKYLQPSTEHQPGSGVSEQTARGESKPQHELQERAQNHSGKVEEVGGHRKPCGASG